MWTWRELCGRYKAQNIVSLCHNLSHLDKVLEVGAGDGSILLFLDDWKFCKELYALEISKSGVEAIKKLGLHSLVTVKQFDGYNIPFEDNYFDLVILSHVIEHVEFPRLLLREIKRVSRYQIIEIPCDYSYQVDKQVDHFLSYGHINIYQPNLLRYLLKSEGFSIISGKTTITAKDVVEFMLFNNLNKPKNLSTIIKLNIKLKIRKVLYSLLSKRMKESYANAYTVLCKKEDKKLRIF